jgi:hypothetical protein
MSGRNFTGRGNTRHFEKAQLCSLRKDSFPALIVSGHDFSRAEYAAKYFRALAPEGNKTRG